MYSVVLHWPNAGFGCITALYEETVSKLIVRNFTGGLFNPSRVITVLSGLPPSRASIEEDILQTFYNLMSQLDTLKTNSTATGCKLKNSPERPDNLQPI